MGKGGRRSRSWGARGRDAGAGGDTAKGVTDRSLLSTSVGRRDDGAGSCGWRHGPGRKAAKSGGACGRSQQHACVKVRGGNGRKPDRQAKIDQSGRRVQQGAFFRRQSLQFAQSGGPRPAPQPRAKQWRQTSGKAAAPRERPELVVTGAPALPPDWVLCACASDRFFLFGNGAAAHAGTRAAKRTCHACPCAFRTTFPWQPFREQSIAITAVWWKHGAAAPRSPRPDAKGPQYGTTHRQPQPEPVRVHRVHAPTPETSLQPRISVPAPQRTGSPFNCPAQTRCQGSRDAASQAHRALTTAPLVPGFYPTSQPRRCLAGG